LFHSPGHIFLFGITTLIFLLATTVIAVGTPLTSQGIPIIIKMIDPSFVIGWSSHKMDVFVGIVAVITRLNARFSSFLYLAPLSWSWNNERLGLFQPTLSDLVCVWRAMVLWKWDRRVVTVLSICMLGTLGVCPWIIASILFGSSVNVGRGLTGACIYDVHLALKAHPGTRGQQNLNEGKLAVIIVAPMLGTNVLSTSLIAWKAWYVVCALVSLPPLLRRLTPPPLPLHREYRRTVGAQLRKGSPSERVEKVLGLLIESGFVYCLLWVIASWSVRRLREKH
jgi:hypothetical protein